MSIIRIIEKKRDKGTLTRDEIREMVLGYSQRVIQDYQMSSFLMTIFFNGLSFRELFHFTEAMIDSGVRIDLGDIGRTAVDKHSTGGVGDKVTLLLGPILASCGLAFAKMSGRSLSFTGGTIDKLESIPGFETARSLADFKEQLRDIGICIIAQTSEIVPADRLIYALRDLTGTVPTSPLIVASILSKKVAVAAQAVVLDIKVGRGSFVHNVSDAVEMGKLCARLGEEFGIKVLSILSSMEEPLGYNVGNALEVVEVVNNLKGDLTPSLFQVTLELAVSILVETGVKPDNESAMGTVMEKIRSLEAYNTFARFVRYQKGDLSALLDFEKFSAGERSFVLTAPNNGYLKLVDARKAGELVIELGGKRTSAQPLDPLAGLILHKKGGDDVEKGEPIMTLYTKKELSDEAISRMALETVEFSDTKPSLPRRVLGKVDASGACHPFE